jgi:thioredoxin 1
MKQILYFTAPWCQPCQVLGPIMDDLSNQFPERIKKVNIDYDPELPQKYSVKNIPTTIVFENGKEIERKVGVQPRSYYVQVLTS